MGILRSEPLRHGTLIFPSEKARAFINTIGHQLSLQFEDMNATDLRRPYRRQVQRLEEIERMLRFLQEEVKKALVDDLRDGDPEKFPESEFSLDSVESEVATLFAQFHRFRANNEELSSKLLAAQEEKEVVTVASASLAISESPRSELQTPLLEPQHSMVSTLAGVLPMSEIDRFARTIFRASRGNCFVTTSEIASCLVDPKSGRLISKFVFCIFFQGGQGTAMREKISRVCQGFGANMYGFPSTAYAAQSRKAELDQAVKDQSEVLKGFSEFLVTESAALAVPGESKNSRLENLKFFTAKERQIYHTLNFFAGATTLRCDCWFPEEEMPKIHSVLLQAGREFGVGATLIIDGPVDETQLGEHGNSSAPPTFIKPNDFTGAFQEIVDTYGVPRYREVNPALFATVTFPFIFGIMYGDVGHGSLLLLAGLWLIKQNPETVSPNLKPFLKARYLLTAMGFFAVYAGFLYNDFFSLGMKFFASRFEHAESTAADGSVEYQPVAWFDSRNVGGKSGPYPFGLDPAWHGASNELLYVNSMKMKLSVLVGVTQMVLGIILKFVNSIHFRNGTDLIFECIPQLAFMVGIFGYMDWMIMYKWVTPVDEDPDLKGAPSIINSLIVMGLGQQDKQPLYEGQSLVQSKLLMIALISVPLMLISKPLILWLKSRRIAEQRAQVDSSGHFIETPAKHSFDLGEVVIHQIIETIEFVLGSVSHTASYLRQWALSLAHQQLSLVFFQKTLVPAMLASFPFNAIWTFIAFSIFMTITAGVLLGMDVLECFLHTLRLHWVEFQSKFYKADGSKFAPFRHGNAWASGS